LLTLLTAYRPALVQERTWQRLTGLVVGWLLTVGRHTLTRVLLTLGLGEADWSAWYRLFGTPRVDYDVLTRTLLRHTLPLSADTDPYLVAVDGVLIPRESRTMPGTSWHLAAGTAPFKRGVRRAQRFVDLDWLPMPSPHGYSRGLPLRWEPAFPPKAQSATEVTPRKEWEAGLVGLQWIRTELDGAARSTQRLFGIADRTYETQGLWRGLPARTDLLARTTKNRALFVLPPAPTGRGRPRKYGPQAPHPADWLPEQTGWTQTALTVRGRTIPVTYRCAGPYLVKGAPQRPLFLLVVKGIAKRSPRHKRRAPSFWLISAVPDDAGGWQLPWPAEHVLTWAWQRWEVEVAHREQKTSFGLGQLQCWGEHSAVLAVQWVGWCYALLVLTGLLVWGQEREPGPRPSRWWAGSGRWSLAQLQQAVRAEVWALADFQPAWTRTTGNWWEMADWLTLQTNALRGASQT
jgi:hypothetical protein